MPPDNTRNDSTEAALLPSLILQVCSTAAVPDQQTKDTIDRIVRSLPAEQLLEVDWRVRHAHWDSMCPPSRLAQLAGESAAVIGLIGCDRSGYTREHAVRLLVPLKDPVATNFLLIRSNDWVRPVQLLAMQAIKERIAYLPPDIWVDALPLVDLLKNRQRGQAAGAVLDFLRQEKNDAALLRGLASRNSRCRAVVTRMAAALPPEREIPFVIAACQSNWAKLRARGADRARNILPPTEIVRLLLPLASDRAVSVRLGAIFGLAERTTAATPALLKAVFDRSRSVREAGRFYLSKVQKTDFAAMYRKNIADSQGDLQANLSGLGECGASADAIIAAQHLHHPSPPVRRAAVIAVAQLNGDAFTVEIKEKLSDPVAAVTKSAARAIARHQLNISEAELKEIYIANPAGRSAVLQLARRLSWWEAAPLLLLAISDDHPQLRHVAESLLRQKAYGVAMARPSIAQVDQLHQMLIARAAYIPKPLADLTRAALDAARRFWSF